jgi:hypothetical protein
MDINKFILGALMEYNKESDPVKKTELYQQTMSVLRASGSARSSEGK